MKNDSFFLYRIAARFLFCALVLKTVLASEQNFVFLGILVAAYLLVELVLSAMSKMKHAAEERTRALEAKRRAEAEVKRKAVEFKEAQKEASRKYFDPGGMYQKKPEGSE